ncbi:gluconeogenesis factor YvcK family protein [Tunturiibacter gelidoferens]|uniref:Putative gluconeogenesis factor n=1 Tax=Tunturiibacter gelidiferens TaxID=3069689 RepID=A0A9X0QHQ5_9BACT|nr:uridine diphosphate-N-acetylglucosamine-binding protein YvcK [Edaphobacter lichenicola]MBB5330575.1 putative cofD-like protein [Edaphobacter lichenicola]
MPSPKLTESKDKDLRVVAIGGGTGLSTLLRGLKRYVVTPERRRGIRLGESARVERPPVPPCPEARCIIRELSAVVTVTDDGGSSGRLREDFKMLPPGDIRNCLVALSEDEHLLSRLFQYRFEHGDLEGHSFGNLFVAALSHITGDFAQAVQMSSQILAARGKIYPATNTNVTLAANMDDGSLVRGETNITKSKRSIVELRLEPELADPLPETLEAIANADLITLGPGSLYTSLITNMLVRGIPEALAASPATKVFVCNLMTQANESLGLTASEHIEKIMQHAGSVTAPIFDYALINTGQISAIRLEQYAREGQQPIEPDLDRVRALGVEPVTGNFVHEGDVLRHDYDLVAERLLGLGMERPLAVAGAGVGQVSPPRT